MSIFKKIGNLFKKKEGGSFAGNLLRKLTGQPTKTVTPSNPLSEEDIHSNPLQEIPTDTLQPSPTIFGTIIDGIKGVFSSAKSVIDKGVNVNTSVDNKSILYLLLAVIIAIFAWKKLKGK